ncbi:MAG: DUF4198 domain-containing protein [Sediminibacterium sp.]|nr:DUF4198 domain-containing protein [Sediminibacterium sp.]
MIRKRSKIALTIVLFIAFTAIFGHEYFILSSKYKVQIGDSVELHLFVADGFNIEAERNFQRKMVRSYELFTNTGKTDITSISSEGALPFSYLPINFSGLGIIKLERDYSKIGLEPEKFREYLKTDHIENVHIDPHEQKIQRERYSRYIKCLLQSNEIANDTLFKIQTGLRFEIIPLNNPYKLKTGDKLSAKILFNNKPLTNKVITARNRIGNKAATMQEARTDKNGICTFIINRKGEWVIHVTHMMECTDKAEADWESFWASLSFGL